MRFIYLSINIFIILILGVLLTHNIQNNGWNYEIFVIVVLVLALSNISLYVIEKFMGILFDYLFNKYEKRKMKNYSLFEWIGEANWFKLYDNLSNIKQFDRTLLSDNYIMIKDEIKKEFNSKESLEFFKLHLEVRVESPRLTAVKTVTQTILIAIITSVLISYVKGMLTFKSSSVVYIIIFCIVWFTLLVAINFFSKEIDKYKILLKLVDDCIKDSQQNKRVRRRIGRSSR